MRLLLCFSAIAPCCIAAPRSVSAQLEIGTWVRKATASTPTMTMQVESCGGGGGRKLTYRVPMGGTDAVLTLSSKLDGTDAPAHEREAERGDHGDQKATLSADGKTLTVASDDTTAVAGNQKGKTTEIFVKQ